METLLMYLLKMIICSAILYAYYRVALYNERFHRWNRFYLLAAMVLSVVVGFDNYTGYGGMLSESASWGGCRVVCHGMLP